jgi:hypothetical protein
MSVFKTFITSYLLLCMARSNYPSGNHRTIPMFSRFLFCPNTPSLDFSLILRCYLPRLYRYYVLVYFLETKNLEFNYVVFVYTQ